MIITRRNALMTTLFGAGYVGLRALATGLPAAFLLDPEKALADNPAPACADKSKAQFIIMNTLGSGDPINANCPGTYEDSKIVHPPAGVGMDPTSVTLGGQSYQAAAPWASLAPWFDRTVFWHMMTNTPVHPKEPEVLRLMGTTYQGEMLPSMLAKQLAPCLGTIQAQPISLGAGSPSEGLTFGGQALPIIPALALKATLTNPAGELTTLQPLRDQTLNKMYDLYKSKANTAQKAYIDSLVTTQNQVRNISQKLLDNLTSIKDNTPASQILAALTLIQMNVTPVIAIRIPFGGDNHRDTGLATESAQTISGVASIVSLLQQLQSLGLSDQVTFMTLDVFGRTIGPGNTDGRQHNPNHQVSLTIGKPFKGGVVGGVAPVQNDYGATAVDSKTGKSAPNGDVSATATLASFGKTLLAAAGADSSTIGTQITAGTVISGALATPPT